MEKIWTEKYRPIKLDDIIGQDEVVKVLKNILQTKSMPHLILYGSTGVGKTSAILSLCYELYDVKNCNDIDEMVLELNASSERGINVVRNDIRTFTEKKMISKYPFKMVILDEADELTNEAQTALREIVGETTNTRFCFICNYPDKLIVPILSRCSKIKFNTIPKKEILIRLGIIASMENMKVTKKYLEYLIKYTYGDIRRCILLLQQLSYIFKTNNIITMNDVYYITNSINSDVLIPLFQKKCDIITLTNNIINEGYNINYVLMILNELNLISEFDNIKKSKIGIKIAETNKYLIDGASEYIQILNLFTFINDCF